MSTYIKHKLNDQSGMTILMALFAFLVAAMVAAVVLAAAMSSMRQAKDNQQHQQDMLILQSAGELIEREMKATEVTVQDVTRTTYKSNGTVKDTTVEHTVTTSSTALLTKQIYKAVEQIYTSDSDVSIDDFVSGTSTINVTADGFSQDVEVSFVFKKPSATDVKSKHLIFTLTTKGNDDDSVHSLIIDFDTSNSSSSPPDEQGKFGPTKHTEIKILSWESPTYKRVGGDE